MVFFVMFIVVAAFIVTSLFIGVVTNAMCAGQPAPNTNRSM